MNTTITKDQMILHEGEVYVIEIGMPFDGRLNQYEIVDLWGMQVMYIKTKVHRITHSTRELDGVIQLNRERFVRGEDVEEKMREYLIYCYGEGPDDFTEEVNQSAKDWKAGYNANKGEFTREQMFQCALQFFYYWYNAKGTNTESGLEKWLPTFINSLQPLSLPNSLTLNKDNEIVKIEF